MKNKKISDQYWHSTKHLYGCYGAIILCILALLNISSFGWFKASVVGYFFGLLVYLIIRLARHVPAIDQPDPILIKDIAASKSNQTPIKPTDSRKNSPTLSPEQQLLTHFGHLHHQIQTLLTPEANHKFQEIQGLLVVLTQKFRRSQDHNTQNEILKIQRIINNYIAPMVQHYQELPVIFHNRKMADELTPNELMLKQLDLIHEEMLKVTEHVFKDDLDALILHGEFLQQKLNPPQFFKVGNILNKS